MRVLLRTCEIAARAALSSDIGIQYQRNIGAYSRENIHPIISKLQREKTPTES